MELPAGITLDNIPSTSNTRGEECTRIPRHKNIGGYSSFKASCTSSETTTLSKKSAMSQWTASDSKD
eukprot:2475358-Pyramimonas_sp.AAC.1